MRVVSLLALLALSSGVMAQSQAVLVVESEPEGAFVTVDGLPLGRTPAVLGVRAGVRVVRVRAVGYRAQEFSREMAAGDTAYVVASLRPLVGSLSIEGVPSGSLIVVSGVETGGTLELPPGDADVLVDVPGQRLLKARVSVASDRQTRLVYAPRRLSPPATLLAAVPGVPQLIGDRPAAGAAALGGLALTLGGAALMGSVINKADRDGAEALRVYGLAATERAAAEARLEVEQAHSRMRTSRVGQRALLAMAGAVYFASVTDALMRHSHRPALVRRPSLQFPVASVEPAGLGLNFSIRL